MEKFKLPSNQLLLTAGLQKIERADNKMGEDFFRIAEAYTSDPACILMLNDEQFIEVINRELPEKKRIKIQTFKNWKKECSPYQDLEMERFRNLIENGLIKIRRYLMSRLMDEPRNWQKWAWIIERKFEDWNLKNKSEFTTTNNDVVETKQIIGVVNEIIANRKQGVLPVSDLNSNNVRMFYDNQ